MGVATQIVPIYSQEQQRQIRLDTCTKCILAKCNGNESNKCNINSLVCSLDNQSIITKTNNLSSVCKKGYWDTTNATKKIQVSTGCGCGG